MAWGSHMPALLAAIGSTTGDVLEIGVGHFSTPQLHYLCGAMGRRLVSIEQNKEWYEPFATKYSSENHTFYQGEYPNILPSMVKLPWWNWSVVFIDHSPGGKSRSDVFSLFIDISEYVVVHDYHLENEDAIKPLLDSKTIHKTIAVYEPPTLIASRKRPIPLILE